MAAFVPTGSAALTNLWASGGTVEYAFTVEFITAHTFSAKKSA
jgi:hypothetical protein